MSAAPFDWQNDPEYADPVIDVLGAADDTRKREKEATGEPIPRDTGAAIVDEYAHDLRHLAASASPPSLEWAANLARLAYETLKPGKASLR